MKLLPQIGFIARAAAPLGRCGAIFLLLASVVPFWAAITAAMVCLLLERFEMHRFAIVALMASVIAVVAVRIHEYSQVSSKAFQAQKSDLQVRSDEWRNRRLPALNRDLSTAATRLFKAKRSLDSMESMVGQYESLRFRVSAAKVRDWTSLRERHAELLSLANGQRQGKLVEPFPEAPQHNRAWWEHLLFWRIRAQDEVDFKRSRDLLERNIVSVRQGVEHALRPRMAAVRTEMDEASGETKKLELEKSEGLSIASEMAKSRSWSSLETLARRLSLLIETPLVVEPVPLSTLHREEWDPWLIASLTVLLGGWLIVRGARGTEAVAPAARLLRAAYPVYVPLVVRERVAAHYADAINADEEITRLPSAAADIIRERWSLSKGSLRAQCMLECPIANSLFPYYSNGKQLVLGMGRKPWLSDVITQARAELTRYDLTVRVDAIELELRHLEESIREAAPEALPALLKQADALARLIAALTETNDVALAQRIRQYRDRLTELIAEWSERAPQESKVFSILKGRAKATGS